MRALPTTRVPCLYPTPRTDRDVAHTAELTTKTTSDGSDVETRVQAFAATARVLLGTTAEFAFLLDGDKVVVVEGVDEHDVSEKCDVLKKEEACTFAFAFSLRWVASEEEQLVSKASMYIST